VTAGAAAGAQAATSMAARIRNDRNLNFLILFLSSYWSGTAFERYRKIPAKLFPKMVGV
jgi:hypothetical protein